MCNGTVWHVIRNDSKFTAGHIQPLVWSSHSETFITSLLRHRYYLSVTVQWPESSEIKIPESLRWRPLIMPRPVLTYNPPSCIWILCCDITWQLTVFKRFNKQQKIINIKKNFHHLILKITCWQYSILKHYDLRVGILNPIFLTSISWKPIHKTIYYLKQEQESD